MRDAGGYLESLHVLCLRANGVRAEDKSARRESVRAEERGGARQETSGHRSEERGGQEEEREAREKKPQEGGGDTYRVLLVVHEAGSVARYARSVPGTA